MKLSFKEWFLFIFLAFVCFGFWYKLSYPQFAFVDLSVSKEEALKKAQGFLDSRGINTKEYHKAVVFGADNWADRYLQKTLGLKSEEEFIRTHDYDLFSWKIRLFKELKKEEFIIDISPKTGKIIIFEHLIEDVEPRESISKDSARVKAEAFIKDFCGINLAEYDFHEEKVKKYEQRIDYAFSWEKKGVYIPWQKEEGGAKLLIGATVSGSEIRGFYKGSLDIPEKFQRYIENQLLWGEYLSSFSFIVFMAFIALSISTVVKKKYGLITRLCKKWFIFLSLFFIANNIVSALNDIQGLIVNYPTSTHMASFIGLYFVRLLINLIFLSIAFLFPGLAGESLRNEVMPDNKYSSFSHYIKSTFYSRGISNSIFLGYFLFFIFLGLQAVIFYFGQKYFGVWREWFKLTHFSSAYIPYLGAFIVGANASLSEEIVFRLFGITLLKKHLRNTVLAVVLTSFIWGMGHSAYPIFPVWFRSIEVGIMGLLFGFIFVTYGLIPLIVAHYLFDVFWGIAAYILSPSPLYLYIGSVAVLFIPFVFAIISHLANKEEKEKDIRMLLDRTQAYNLDILKTFLTVRKSQGVSVKVIKEELLRHNWDAVLIDEAIKEVYG